MTEEVRQLNKNSSATVNPMEFLEWIRFAVESCQLSRRQALIELGFRNVDALMAERFAEDLRLK